MADSTFSTAVLDVLTWLKNTSIRVSGSRGSLAGYNTPQVNSSSGTITINGESNDDIVITNASAKLNIPNGNSGECWIKTVSIVNSSVSFATPGFGTAWKLAGGEPPAIGDNCVLILYWNGTYGVVQVNLGEG